MAKKFEALPKEKIIANPLFNSNGDLYCPLCDKYHPSSSYLAEAIEDIKVRFVANMVTHYRHNHISHWDRNFGFDGHLYRRSYGFNYESAKTEVNERAKRQIIRYAKDYLIHYGIDVGTFKGLEYNEIETLELAQKKLIAQTPVK